MGANSLNCKNEGTGSGGALARLARWEEHAGAALPIGLLAAVAAAHLAVAPTAFAKPLWLDEVLTAANAGVGRPDWALMRVDPHPPGYTLAVSAWRELLSGVTTDPRAVRLLNLAGLIVVAHGLWDLRRLYALSGNLSNTRLSRALYPR